MGNRPPAQWLSPTIGTVLRMAFGAEFFRLQFVSVAVGAGVVRVVSVARSGTTGTGPSNCRCVLLVSFVTAPYGAWPFDMVLLLPAIFAMMVGEEPPARSLAAPPSRGEGQEAESRSRSPPLPLGGGVRPLRPCGLVAVNLGCLVMNLCQTGSFWFLWVSPAVLLLYAIHMKSRGLARNPPSYPSTVPA